MNSANRRYHVIISERAAEMLVQHARFLTQVSAQAADKLRRDIVESVKSLQEFPERGSWLTDRVLPVDKYRKLLVDKRYLLIYQIKGDTVYLDYIVDCRQDYGWLL
ncbi:MAG: plasmid stabilization protein [Firmicutes bacterium HGW-Firmicutes-8]|nr:MAG: plasmid stabilization protein [Firmicutes bacterium HGW-Firmicutes-8]